MMPYEWRGFGPRKRVFRFHLSVCPSISEIGASFTEKTAMIAAAQKKTSDNVAHANAMKRSAEIADALL
jgi:hypothetical protein